MNKCRLIILILFLACFSPSCGTGGGGWSDLNYDVAPEATLDQVLSDLSALTGASFAMDEDLRARLNEEAVDLPTLTGLNVEEVLMILEDTMPPDLAFIYQELSDGSILLRPRFQQAEDVSAADPITILEFHVFTEMTALYSEPLFDEDCDEPVESIVDLWVDVASDPGGHAEFIGTFPTSVAVLVSGETMTVSGESPWVSVSGTVQGDGSFAASGAGTVAGFPDVTVTFEGQTSSGGISGTLTMGVGGELPGGEAIVYNVNP